MDFEFDLENRIVDPEDIPEDADIENPRAPGRFRNISARKKRRKTSRYLLRPLSCAMNP